MRNDLNNLTSSSDMDDRWIPILDYAVMKGISTSTLRRYIKANKIQYKIENGRYLLWADSKPVAALVRPNWDGYNPHVTIAQHANLEEKLMRAQEQIAELKMLVATYEEMLAQKDR